jgi:hypothetical protein
MQYKDARRTLAFPEKEGALWIDTLAAGRLEELQSAG